MKPGARQRPLDSNGAWWAPVEGLVRGPALLHLCHAWLNASLRIASVCSLLETSQSNRLRPSQQWAGLITTMGSTAIRFIRVSRVYEVWNENTTAKQAAAPPLAATQSRLCYVDITPLAHLGVAGTFCSESGIGMQPCNSGDVHLVPGCD